MMMDDIDGAMDALCATPGATPADARTAAARMQILEDLGMAQEQEFDDLVQLAAVLCGTAASWITFFGEMHPWYKASFGMDPAKLTLDPSICLIDAPQPHSLIVQDLFTEEQSRDLPCVGGEPRLRFYAGLALRNPAGCVVGALSVAAPTAHRLLAAQRNALQAIGRQVEACLLLRLQERALRNALAINQALIQTFSRANGDLKRVLDAVPTIIIGLDRTGRVSYWNAVAERTFHLAEDAVFGRPFYECGVGWMAERSTLDALHSTMVVDDRSDHPFMLNGEKRWLGLAVRGVDRRGSGSETTVLLSGADITDRRVQEEQTRQLHKMEAIGQLAAGIAHEINTPTQYVGDNIDFVQRSMADVLATMACAVPLRDDYAARCGKTEVLRAYDERLKAWDAEFVLSEIPSALQQALDGTKRIGSIVRAMKEFSHPGSETKTKCDLNHAIDLTVIIARSEWKYAAQLETQLATNLPHVLCYPGEINQVLLNLIVNATHAIQERATLDSAAPPGLIRILTRQVEDGIEVCVEDNGIGIPTEIQTRVFELFFTTKDVGKGTGQGLAFAHSVIVKKHAGQLWFDSVRFHGTSFYLRLPFAG